MTKIYSSLPHINGNLLCAIDLECTGLRSGYHEIIQIAVIPLDHELNPNEAIRPIQWNLQPMYIARAEAKASETHKLDLYELAKHGIHPDRAQDLLIEWFENLQLPREKRIVPLAHNWAYEYSFLNSWLGPDLMHALFHAHARDSMALAIALNDLKFMLGRTIQPSSVSLPALCVHYGITNQKPHDAFCDALAGAQLYRCLLKEIHELKYAITV